MITMQGDGCINYTYCGNHFTIYTCIKSLILYLKFPQLYVICISIKLEEKKMEKQENGPMQNANQHN